MAEIYLYVLYCTMQCADLEHFKKVRLKVFVKMSVSLFYC